VTKSRRPRANDQRLERIGPRVFIEYTIPNASSVTICTQSSYTNGDLHRQPTKACGTVQFTIFRRNLLIDLA
jgi:hypothetical protein